MNAPQSLSQDSQTEEKRNWLGTIAVWLSAISMVVYFCSSYGIRNHILFLAESLRKVLEKI